MDAVPQKQLPGTENAEYRTAQARMWRQLGTALLLLGGLALLAALFLPGPGYAQSDTEALEQVYEQFSAAYDSLDAARIAPLYTEDALYLTPNSEQGIRQGRDNILRSFRNTFARARKRGSTLKMTFRIVDRDVEDSLAYDVGYYKFEAVPKEGDAFRSAGKFVTVLKHGDNGQWQFHVDAYSRAPLAAFEEVDP